MPKNTATGLTVPELTDAADPPADFLRLAKQLDVVTIPVFDSEASRDAAYGTGASQAQFNLCIISGTLYRRRGGGWKIIGDYEDPIHGFATAAANVTITTQYIQRFGPLIWLMVSVDYAGDDLTTNSVGNVTTTTMFTLDTAWRPINLGHFPPLVCMGAYNAAAPNGLWSCVVKGSGEVAVAGGIPGLSIKAGDTLTISGTLLIS